MNRPSRRPGHRPGNHRPPDAGHRPKDRFQVREIQPTAAAQPEPPTGPGPFRIVIAVHRPRYRGRTERAAAIVGWEITSLLNKQDPVGICAKGPRPPDILILSHDFGRQKDLAIFRAVQSSRARGMLLIGMVENCGEAPESHPETTPEQLCDVCFTPPYKTANLRALLQELYMRIRGEEAPPPIQSGAGGEMLEDSEEDQF